MEYFKDVPGFEGKFKVSQYGKILDEQKELFRKPYLSNRGYFYVSLNSKKCSIHWCVISAFRDKPNPKYIINHIDCNKQNNNLENLEWVSERANYDHALKNNLYPKGNSHKRSKLTCAQVLEIRSLYKPRIVMAKDLAIKFKVSKRTIRAVLERETWKHI